MKALDTNVLVRFLVKDDAEQAQLVYTLFKQAENQKQQLFVPILVVLETIWVLQAVYLATHVRRDSLKLSLAACPGLRG